MGSTSRARRETSTRVRRTLHRLQDAADRVGGRNIDKPGIFDLKGRHKWDAWMANKGTCALLSRRARHIVGAGLSKEEAQSKYVALVEELAQRHA